MSNRDSELKPCPFCGGKAQILIGGIWPGIDILYVDCVECHCRLGDFETEEDAIEVWNTRVSEKSVQVSVRSDEDEMSKV